MKKQLTAVLLIFALLLTMSGCSVAHAVQKLDAAEDRVEAKLDAAEDRMEAKLDAAEDKLENNLRNNTSSTPAVPKEVPQAPAPVETQPIPENTQKLTKEQALEIALKHLGFSADQITRLRTEYEIDDGIPQFDIEFHQGDWEYEFEIHAENGKILSYDKDHKYD